MNTVSIDLKNATNNGQFLWQWLGGFWQHVYQDPNFAKDVEYSQGLMSIQLYLDFVESMNRINRYNVPVFHRERWKPIRILKSQAGTGNAALLRIGANPLAVIGPQVTSDYVQDEVFKIGGTTDLSGSVSYPITGVQVIMAAVCDNIMAPKSVLISDTDFIVRDSTIFFLREKDPFSDPAFPKRNVSNADGSIDQELVLWCMDSLQEAEYVYNQLGYIFNVKMPSSELYKTMMNRIWDMYNFGTPVQLLQSGLGAILNESTVLNSEETVAKILYNEDSIQVITDKEVYVLPVTSTLRSNVIPGAVMYSGDFFTQTIRLYSNINPRQLNTAGEYGTQFRTDVPAMFFGPDMFRSELRFGIGVSWQLSDIVSAGTDLNGNPKLMFELFGDPEDVSRFWQDFWAYCELNKISSETCFADYLDPAIGTTYGRVAPLEYFLRYFLRPNLCVVVVNSDTLSPEGLENLNQLQLLKDVLPAHVLMIVTVERRVEEAAYDLSTLTESAESMPAILKSDTARPGGPSSLSLTYRDRCPILRWIPTCGRSA